MASDPQAAAAPVCDHYWAHHVHGGLSVRLCQFCHEPDWEDLAGQLGEAERKGELAERQRIYGVLGNDHYVIFTEDGFTTEHSLDCRLSGHMHECAYHAAAALVADEYEPAMAGRWKITDIDSEGLPSLEGAADHAP